MANVNIKLLVKLKIAQNIPKVRIVYLIPRNGALPIRNTMLIIRKDLRASKAAKVPYSVVSVVIYPI